MGSVYFLLGDGAKHCFDLRDEIQRSERPGAERCGNGVGQKLGGVGGEDGGLELISLRVTVPRLEQMAE
jgi:hypothetical protein